MCIYVYIYACMCVCVCVSVCVCVCVFVCIYQSIALNLKLVGCRVNISLTWISLESNVRLFSLSGTKQCRCSIPINMRNTSERARFSPMHFRGPGEACACARDYLRARVCVCVRLCKAWARKLRRV